MSSELLPQETFTVTKLNICRKLRHQQKTNQCHLLVLFIIISLAKLDLQRQNVSCIPQVQARTKTVKRTGKAEKGDLQTGSVTSVAAHNGHGRQCRHAPPESPATYPPKGRLSHNSTPGILRCRRHLKSNGIDLFSLASDIQCIGQPIGHPHREYILL